MMKRRRTRSAILLTLLVIAAALSVSRSSAAPAATTEASDASFDVREWVVFVVDPNHPHANSRGDFPSTLPPFMDSRRSNAEASAADRAMPIGVIRFFGTSDPQMPVDVSLTVSGDAESHWPHAQNKPHRLLWTNLTVDDNADGIQAIDPKHWLAGLRTGDAAAIHSGKQTDRFIVYDVETNCTPAITLARNGQNMTVTNSSDQPLYDVSFYRKQSDHWTTSVLDTLAPAVAPKAAKKKNDPAAAFDTPGATTKPAATAPATQTTTTKGTAVALLPSDSGDDRQVLEPWRSRLQSAGVLPSDVDTILNILQANALDSRWLTAVYRLDPAELDRLLPIEIVPAPKKMSRIGLVIVRNIDPAIADDIDRLIQQCGDDDYTKRQAATTELIALGAAAKSKVQAAEKNPDIEISQRAESILAAMEQGGKP